MIEQFPPKKQIELHINQIEKIKKFQNTDFKNIINNEIDNRNRLERLGEWDDADLLRRREFEFKKMIPEQDIPLRGFDLDKRREKIEAWRKDIPKFGALEPMNVAPRVEVPQFEIVPGTVEALSGFLHREPQKDGQGRIRYLLTSGLAVEVITGATRYHHDVDLVLFDENNGWWAKYATDNVTPEKYWADMKFDPEYLEETAWNASFQVDGREKTVSTVHPAIILVQKLSDAWGRPPRKRDTIDVEQLMKFWRDSLASDPKWVPIIESAIEALPKPERDKTRRRLLDCSMLVSVPVQRKLHFLGFGR